MEFVPGDRVHSPHLGPGTVQPPLWPMPNHHLVQFDSGKQYWVLREILTPAVSVVAIAEVKPIKQTKRRRAA